MSVHDVIEVGTFEAKNNLSALVEKASTGKRIWITKHGKRMALLSSGLSEAESTESDTLQDTFSQLRAASVSNGTSIRELIEEGRS